MEAEPNYTLDGIKIGLTVVFIILNGFFVAAEFALVKLTKSKIKKMIREKQPFATTAMWLFKRQNLALSACQLGITMASLALGWIGEPAIAHLITPLIQDLGFTSENLIHGIAFTIAFTTITAFHIVIGEQVPKIYAIRKPAPVFLGSALLLKGFYMLLYPFMFVLNAITNVILKWLGIEESDEHDSPLSEEEIQASLSIAYAKGELTKNEHRLLNAVFRFDDTVAKQILKPRHEVEFLDVNDAFEKNLQFAQASRHTRFPLCDDSLDKVVGVVHIKDIVGYNQKDTVDLQQVARPSMMVPENILLSKLLQEFRNARQHLAFVQDEYGTVLGIVTLEDLLEELVGSMQDEFDIEEPEIIEQKEGVFTVNGDVQIEEINERFKLHLTSEDADTISGLIVEKVGHKLETNKIIDLEDGISAEVLEIKGIRAGKIRIKISDSDDSAK